MKILATKEGGKLLNEDLETRSRQNGLVVVENESGTVPDEVDDFQRMEGIDLDSDVLPDELLKKLLNYLKREALLEK